MAEKSNGIANRKSPRRAFLRPVGTLVNGVYRVLVAKQISEGGMLIQGDLGLMAGDRLVVSILLPDGGFAVARAKVVYITKDDPKGKAVAFGLQFLELPLPKKRLIRNYVAAKTAAEAESEFEANTDGTLSTASRDHHQDSRKSASKTASKNKKAA